MPISFYKNSSSSGMSPEALDAVLKRLGGDTSVQLPEQKRKGKLSGYVSWGNPPAGFGSRGSSASAEDILAEALIKDALSANAEKRRTEAEIAKEGRDAKQARQDLKFKARLERKGKAFDARQAEDKRLQELAELGMAADYVGLLGDVPTPFSLAGRGAIAKGIYGNVPMSTARSGADKTNAENLAAVQAAKNAEQRALGGSGQQFDIGFFEAENQRGKSMEENLLRNLTKDNRMLAAGYQAEAGVPTAQKSLADAQAALALQPQQKLLAEELIKAEIAKAPYMSWMDMPQAAIDTRTGTYIQSPLARLQYEAGDNDLANQVLSKLQDKDQSYSPTSKKKKLLGVSSSGRQVFMEE